MCMGLAPDALNSLLFPEPVPHTPWAVYLFNLVNVY